MDFHDFAKLLNMAGKLTEHPQKFCAFAYCDGVCGYESHKDNFLTICRLEVCRSISLRLDTPAPDLLLSSNGKLVLQNITPIRLTSLREYVTKFDEIS